MNQNRKYKLDFSQFRDSLKRVTDPAAAAALASLNRMIESHTHEEPTQADQREPYLVLTPYDRETTRVALNVAYGEGYGNPQIVPPVAGERALIIMSLREPQ